MPELPEVQIVVNGLNQYAAGARIADVVLHWPPYLVGADEESLRKSVQGKTIEKASRLAKYIYIHIPPYVLQLHLRMTGVLSLVVKDEEPRPHTHLQIQLEDGRRMDFSDVRKFGRVQLLREDQLAEHQSTPGLGPDPLLDKFDAEVLAKICAGRSKSIKNILLDQKLVAGIGNIYAVEVLYRCGVLPTRAGADVSKEELAAIARTTHEILGLAIVNGGSSINDYLQVSGEKGEMQNHFFVYGREGSECPRCGATIERLVQSGRSSFFCPGCQQ